MRYQSMVLATSCELKKFVIGSNSYYYIESFQPKTSTYTAIPLLKPVLEIVRNNNNSIPKWSSNGKINKYLKMLFSEIDSQSEGYEIKNYYRDGEVKQKKKVYELITAHDTKKSFVTNLSLLNARQDVIDNISHRRKKKDNEMLSTYLKSTMIDKAKQFVTEINKIDSELYTF